MKEGVLIFNGTIISKIFANSKSPQKKKPLATKPVDTQIEKQKLKAKANAKPKPNTVKTQTDEQKLKANAKAKPIPNSVKTHTDKQKLKSVKSKK
jgi:hypothetical protein